MLNTTALLKQKFLAEGKSQEQVDKLDLKDDVLRRANGSTPTSPPTSPTTATSWKSGASPRP